MHYMFPEEDEAQYVKDNNVFIFCHEPYSAAWNNKKNDRKRTLLTLL